MSDKILATIQAHFRDVEDPRCEEKSGNRVQWAQIGQREVVWLIVVDGSNFDHQRR